MRDQALKRRIMPDEFAQMVLFLAADDGAACTAQQFIVDGGRFSIESPFLHHSSPKFTVRPLLPLPGCPCTPMHHSDVWHRVDALALRKE
jgi:hypothetical protein